MEPPTIISISQHGIKYTVELPWDANVSDVVEAYKGLLLAVGYNSDMIDEYIPEWVFKYLPIILYFGTIWIYCR